MPIRFLDNSRKIPCPWQDRLRSSRRGRKDGFHLIAVQKNVGEEGGRTHLYQRSFFKNVITSFTMQKGILTESMHGGANEVIGKRPITSLILERNAIADDSPSMEMQQIIYSLLEGEGRSL